MKNLETQPIFRTLSPVKQSPFYSEVKKHVEEWISEFNLLDLSNKKLVFKLAKSDFYSFSTYNWPSAKLEESKLLGEFTFWMFIYDDWFEKVPLEEFKKVNLEIFKVMDDRNLINKENIFVVSFSDFFYKLKKIVSIDCLKRFVYYMKLTLTVAEEEMEINQRGYFNNLEEYIRVRRDSSAVYPSLALIELVKNIDSEIMDNHSEKIQKLMDLANEQVSFLNDYISYKREKASNNITNLVITAEKLYNYSSKEALIYTFNEIEKRTNEFEKLYLTIDPINESELKSFADGIIEWMSGHLEWYKHTKRYTEQIFLIEEEKAKELVCNIEQIKN